MHSAEAYVAASLLYHLQSLATIFRRIANIDKANIWGTDWGNIGEVL